MMNDSEFIRYIYLDNPVFFFAAGAVWKYKS